MRLFLESMRGCDESNMETREIYTNSMVDYTSKFCLPTRGYRRFQFHEQWRAFAERAVQHVYEDVTTGLQIGISPT